MVKSIKYKIVRNTKNNAYILCIHYIVYIKWITTKITVTFTYS
jgi:hypothetical protein